MLRKRLRGQLTISDNSRHSLPRRDSNQERGIGAHATVEASSDCATRWEKLPKTDTLKRDGRFIVRTPNDSKAKYDRHRWSWSRLSFSPIPTVFYRAVRSFRTCCHSSVSTPKQNPGWSLGETFFPPLPEIWSTIAAKIFALLRLNSS